jgi:hypothetical protein
MIFPQGLSYAALEGKQTAKVSEIHEAIADLAIPATMAAPSCRVTNRVLGEMVAWFKVLKGLPASAETMAV